MMSAGAALALTVTLLLLVAPGGALAQGAGRGRGKNVLKRSKPTPADLDRSILLEWREGSPQLLQVWSDENAPVSAWEGVTVGAERRVVKIKLESKGLTGVVPPALGGLTALTVLDLHANELTGSLPAALGNLNALKRLRLELNQLTAG
jgi:Leucine-rich repeat (LRR) protein